MTSQSGVLEYAYTALESLLQSRATQSGIFVVTPGMLADKAKNGTVLVQLVVTDVCQIQHDKNGQRLIVDEKLYELPALFVCTFGLHFFSVDCGKLLGAVGSVVAFLKDNATIPLEQYNWHGNTVDRLFIEPVVREPVTDSRVGERTESVTLYYKIEAGINSENGMPFKRVEKRDIRSKLMDENTDEIAD